MPLPDADLPEQPSRALSLAIDAAALAGNWRALSDLSGSAAAGAAVKADAYGIGARQAVPILRDAGCRDFFVAHWSEVGGIHGLVPAEWISVLHGPLTDQDASFAQRTGVRPVINSLGQAHRWLNAGGGRCDLMVDTGINRLGLPLQDLGDEAIARLDVDVLMSHLASADEDVPLNAVQQQSWHGVLGAVPHRRASLANSAGIALGADYHGDLTRPGVALYGGVPRPELAGKIRQVARPCAAIMQVRDLQAGDSVGYNATYVAQAAMRVGVIALGYADGYLRCWSSKGRMLHHGRVLPVLGRVSMDMTVIDLSAAPDLGEGDWIEADYSLPDAAAATGLSQYELLTLLADRFAR
ncbi:MAG: alanine racemase [Novosphingobium sp.]